MKPKTKITAVLLAALMIITAAGSSLLLPVFAADKSESQLQAQIDKLEKEQKDLNKKLNQLANDKKEEQQYQKTLDKQIDSTINQIDALESQITVYNNKIAVKEKEIADKTADIDANYSKMLERLTAMQLAGENSMLTALMSAEDFTDLLTRAEMIQSVAERDQALINRLAQEKSDIEAAKKEIEDSKAKVEGNLKTLSAKKSSLQSSISKSKTYMASINAERENYLKRKAQIDKEEAAAQAELDKLYAEHQSSGSLSGKGWMFPVKARHPYISSPFGNRPSMGDYHKGVDLSCSGGSSGKPIVASKPGTVIKTVKTSPETGYGNYIVIDHGKGSDGNGYSTLYAHCSSVSVSTGQTVKQGDVIGYVGNTGNSFGAHLHFEVRINGKYTNPMNYIKLP